ncbi:hypothetical protein ACIPJS_39490 [Streptomyces sp. NPDC086783]|uniref:hypothetical protein n=1 Tax=Streptomyces sp. NPDC086783 TaxID=3365758 RepID=UPI0037F68202
MLPVMVREQVVGDPVKMNLTLTLDVCAHLLLAFRPSLVSDTSVDGAIVLRDVTMPLRCGRTSTPAAVRYLAWSEASSGV